MKIRPADSQEAERIVEVHLRTALHAYSDVFPPEAPPPTTQELRENWSTWLRDERYRAFVADEGGQVVGVALTGPDPEDEALGHLSRLYVEPALWGQGIGRALYQAGIGHLKAKGFTTTTLWVLEANESARAWYERLGWQLTGERKPVFAPAGIDDVRFRLRLA